MIKRFIRWVGDYWHQILVISLLIGFFSTVIYLTISSSRSIDKQKKDCYLACKPFGVHHYFTQHDELFCVCGGEKDFVVKRVPAE